MRQYSVVVLVVFSVSTLASAQDIERVTDFDEATRSLLAQYQAIHREASTVRGKEIRVLDLLHKASRALIGRDGTNEPTAALAKIEEARALALAEPALGAAELKAVENFASVAQRRGMEPAAGVSEALREALVPLKNSAFGLALASHFDALVLKKLSDDLADLSAKLAREQVTTLYQLYSQEVGTVGGSLPADAE